MVGSELTPPIDMTAGLLMGETLRDLPAVLVLSPFFAHIFSMHGAVRMQKSGLAQGPKPHFFFGPMYAFVGGAGWVRLSAAQPNPSSIQLGPCPPRFPGPLRHPPRPSPSPVQVWRHFATFFLLAAGHARPGAKTRGFHAQGGCRGVWGRKGAVQGPPMYPSNGPIAGLVEGDT